MHTALIDRFETMLGIVLYMSLPPLVGAMVVGLGVGILQAVTQVQDQSLPVVVKLLIVMAIISLGGPLLVTPLVQQSVQLFDTFPLLTR
jgi:type III secretion protein S